MKNEPHFTQRQKRALAILVLAGLVAVGVMLFISSRRTGVPWAPGRWTNNTRLYNTVEWAAPEATHLAHLQFPRPC